MSFILPSPELLAAYALCDAHPTPKNQYNLYLSILRIKPDLESIQYALQKLLEMNDSGRVPHECLIEIFYHIAYAYYLQKDYSKAAYYCERVLEKRRLHVRAKELFETVTKLREDNAVKGQKKLKLKNSMILGIQQTASGALSSSPTTQQSTTLGAPPQDTPTESTLSVSLNTTSSLPNSISPPLDSAFTSEDDMSISFDELNTDTLLGVSPPMGDNTHHQRSDSSVSETTTDGNPFPAAPQTPTVQITPNTTTSVTIPTAPPQTRARTKTTFRTRLFGKFTSSPSKSTPLSAEEHEHLLLNQLFVKHGSDRLRDVERKQYAQIFGIISKNVPSTSSTPTSPFDTESYIDDKALTNAFGAIFRDLGNLPLPREFFFNGFCRYINSFVHDHYHDINEASSKHKKLRTPLPSTPLRTTYTPYGLTKTQFLFILAIMLHGSIEEKLNLSFQCFNTSNEGFVYRDDVMNVGRDVCHILSGLNIALGSASSVSELIWQILSAGVPESSDTDQRLTREQFLSNGERYFSKLAGLGLVISNPFTPTPKIRGLRTIPGDREWDHAIELMTAFRISAQMMNGGFLSGREPSPEDFEVKVKFPLPKRTTQSGTSHFTVYAPHVFARIREMCDISDSEFFYSLGVESLLGNLMLGNLISLNQLGSDGRSGASFLYSSDGRYVIKAIPSSEMKEFLNTLRDYYTHISAHPDSLLCRYLACAQLNTSYFVIMRNIFMTSDDIDEIYDLKGSVIARSNPRGPVKKDNDLNYEFDLGKERAEKLRYILTRDVRLLEQLRFTDYSLLVGVQVMTFSGSGEYSNSPLFDENNGILSRDGKRRFWLGIIDTFTTYSVQKKMEKNLKIIGYAARADTISSQSADVFAGRFIERVIDKLVV